MRKNLRRLLVVAAVVTAIAGLWVLYAYDPAQTAFFPKCIIYSITGLQCPGCGMQRSLHALLHGEFVASLTYNPFLYFTVMVLMLIRFFPRLTGRSLFGYVVATLVIAYTIGRNLVAG